MARHEWSARLYCNMTVRVAEECAPPPYHPPGARAEFWNRWLEAPAPPPHQPRQTTGRAPLAHLEREQDLEQVGCARPPLLALVAAVPGAQQGQAHLAIRVQVWRWGVWRGIQHVTNACKVPGRQLAGKASSTTCASLLTALGSSLGLKRATPPPVVSSSIRGGTLG